MPKPQPDSPPASGAPDLRPNRATTLKERRAARPVANIDPITGKYRPTNEQRQMVMVLAANHVTKDVIADALQLNKKTLDHHYRAELRKGWANISARVGAVVVREALAGNIGAARFWLLTHGGPSWRLPKESARYDRDESREENRVQFYLPENGRNRPEEVEVPTIEGEAVTETDEAPDAAAA